MGRESAGRISRRAFLGASAAAFSFSVAPGGIFGANAPSSKLNLAGVGVGGVGKSYLAGCGDENIMALCDVDSRYAAEVCKKYPKASVYTDFRKMLDKEKSIDGVVIGTPDHWHAIIANQAMKMGKHVYCAKPLTRTIHESRVLARTAGETGVATQMSVQSDDNESQRILTEWIDDGAIGKVREVHVWSNRPIWPQGLDRPADKPPAPDGLDWDMWLGPAPTRPYHPIYAPFKWRGWYDFGTGALGDMGCHAFVHIVKVLRLTQPTSVNASSTKLFKETFPWASKVHWEFPARGDMPPVKVTWYDGGLKPRRPDALEDGRKLANEGLMFVGDEGTILGGFTGGGSRLLPETKMREYKQPARKLPRSIGHYREWCRACKGGEHAGVHFPFGGPLNEIVLLGNLAIRRPGKLLWDYENMRITNDEDANKLIKEPFHNGWTL